jgi:hypothetical protein
MNASRNAELAEPADDGVRVFRAFRVQVGVDA